MLAVGSCNMVQYSDPLPDIYQNFYSVDGVDEKDVSRYICFEFEISSPLYIPLRNGKKAIICKRRGLSNSLVLASDWLSKSSVWFGLTKRDSEKKVTKWQAKFLSFYKSLPQLLICKCSINHFWAFFIASIELTWSYSTIYVCHN